MHWRTLAGLLLVVGIGMAFAWFFRKGAAAPQGVRQPAEFTANRGSPSPTPRGQIVPLVVGEEFTGTAFLPAQRDTRVEREASAAARVSQPPTIRRKPIIDNDPTPQLASEFPQPLRLLGLEDRVGLLGTPEFAFESDHRPLDLMEAERNFDAENSTPPAHRLVEDTVPAPPTKHVIVDGDTLPGIALQYLDDRSRAEEIFRLNRTRLPSFDLLPIGVEIELPSR